MTSGQDVSEYLDTLGLVESYFFKFFEKIVQVFWDKKSCNDFVLILNDFVLSPKNKY
jgi:hypothetical protein